MKRGDVLKTHPAMVPLPGAEWLFRDESTGETWVGVKHSYDEILILRRHGHDVMPAGIASDPRFDQKD